MDRTKSSDFLTKIVKKHNSHSVIDHSDTGTETENENTQSSSDSDEEIIKKESKRRRTSDGMQKVWKSDKDEE